MLSNTLVESLLGLDECILSVTLINMNGQIVDYKSKYNIPHRAVSKLDHEGMWIRAVYAMVSQCAKTFGKVQAFVSLHEKAKLLVLPISDINALLLLTALPSADTEYILAKIESHMTNSDLSKRYQSDCKDNCIAPNRKWFKR